jgi:hypothetical protein
MTLGLLRLFLQAPGTSVRPKLNYPVSFRVAHLIAEDAGSSLRREGFAVKIEFPVENIVAQDE